MSTHESQPSPIGDANVERLIEKAYKPESPTPGLLPRVSGEMHAAAAKPQAAKVEPDEFRRLLPLFNVMVAAILLIALVAHFLSPSKRTPTHGEQAKGSPT